MSKKSKKPTRRVISPFAKHRHFMTERSRSSNGLYAYLACACGQGKTVLMEAD